MSNIVRFMDYQAEDAMARLTEQALQERRKEQLAERRRIERERRMRAKWISNVIVIAAVCAACFIAGMCVGVM